MKGELTVNGQTVKTSDGVAVWDEALISLNAVQDSEILLFDLPPAQ